MNKSILRFGATAAFLATSSCLSPIPALAHEAPCPYCGSTITQDTPTQDNEVALKLGRKRIEYKCVFCALMESATEHKGDLTILAPSEKKGEPVKLTRTGGKWSALPTNPVFVAQKANHKICQDTYRAFSTTEAANAYIQSKKDTLGDTKPISLEAMLKLTGNTTESQP